MLVRHTLDMMQCEKNVCDNMFKTIFGDKDEVVIHIEVEEIGILPFWTINTHVEFQLLFSLKNGALLQGVIRFKVCV